MKLHLPKLLRTALLGLFAMAAPCAVTIATASSAAVLFSIAHAEDVTFDVADGATQTAKPTRADGSALAAGDDLTINIADNASVTWASGSQIDVAANTVVNIGAGAELTINPMTNKFGIFFRGTDGSQTLNLGANAVMNTESTLAGWAEDPQQGPTTVNMESGSVWHIKAYLADGSDKSEYMTNTTINMNHAVLEIGQVVDANGNPVGSIRTERYNSTSNSINTVANASGMSRIAGAGKVHLNRQQLNFGVVRGGFDYDGDNTADLRIETVVTGSNSLNKTGDGILELANAGNDYTGASLVNAGTLRLGGEGGKAGTGTITVAEGAVLELAHTAACTTGNNITNNGTLSVTGVDETLANMTGSGRIAVAAGAQLTVGGTIALAQTLVNDGTITLGDDAVFDLTSMAMERTENGGRWQVLTGSQHDLQTLVGDKDLASLFLTGLLADGKTWSVGEDGYLSYILEAASFTCTGKGTEESPLSWTDGTQMDGDAPFTQGSPVTFKETNYVALGADIQSAGVVVDENAALFLNMSGRRLQTDLIKLGANSTLTLTGTTLSNGKLAAAGFELDATSALVIAWTGRGYGNNFFPTYHGNIVVKAGASLMCGYDGTINTDFSQVTVEDGGQFATNGSHRGNVTITGDGVDGTNLDQKGALKLGDNTTLTGDVTIKGGSAAISAWRNQGGTINGDITAEQADSTLKLLNGYSDSQNWLVVQGDVSGVKTFEVERGTLTLNGAVTGITDQTLVKTGAGSMVANADINGGIAAFDVQAGTLTLNGAVTGISDQTLVKTGAGSMAVSQDISGDVTTFDVQAGTLSLQSVGNHITMTGNGILAITSAEEGIYTMSGDGSGTVVQDMTDGNFVVEAKNGMAGYGIWGDTFAGYVINGDTACTGDLTIKSGTVSYGDNIGADAGNLQMKSITVSEGAMLRIRNRSTDSVGTDINLDGGKLYMHDSTEGYEQRFGNLNVSKSSELQICWKGSLHFSALTGDGDLSILLVGQTIATQSKNIVFDTVENYAGTVTNSIAANYEGEYSIGSVHQDAGLTATFTGTRTLTSTAFRKTGEGGLNLANLTASGRLTMNYGGELSIGTLTVAEGTTLVYTTDAGVIKPTDLGTIGANLTLDLSGIAGNDVNLGLLEGYDTDQLTVTGLTQDAEYTIAAMDDGYLHLTLSGGSSLGVAYWDINWGGDGLSGVPATLAAADLSGETGEVFAVAANPDYTPEGAGYAAIELTGEGNASLVVLGGKVPLLGINGNLADGAESGTVTLDTWIRATEGTYKGLVGGNRASNWGTSGGDAMSFVGNRHILVDGAEVGFIIGSNWEDGQKPDLQGDVYISVKSGKVTGGIIGGSVTAHNKGTTMTGDVNIFVYTLFESGSVSGVNYMPNAIIGGNAYGTNVAPNDEWAQTLTGNTRIVVDLSSYTGEAGALGKVIVGGNYTSRDAAYKQLLTGNTEVIVDLAGEDADGNAVTHNTAHKVVGGSWVNRGGSKIIGNTNLTIKNGTFTQQVIGGSYADQGSPEIDGNTSLTIKNGTFSSNAQVIGGSYANVGTSTITGNTSLTIEGGTLNRQVIGGTVCNNANYDNNNIVIGGQSNLVINGGEIHEQVIGGVFMQSSAAAQVSIGSVGIALNGGELQYDLIGVAYAIDGRFNLQVGQTDIVLNGGSIGRKLVGGMLIQGSSANSQEDTVLGDINITLGGSTVATFYGGTYNQRNSTDGKNITQGNITLNLNSGTVGNVYAAGSQLGSSCMTTAGTTVNLGKDVTFNNNSTLSGGYEFGANRSGSTVTGARTLVFTSNEAYANLGTVTIKDFDVVRTSGVDMDLTSNFTVADSGLTKQGAGKLTIGEARGVLGVEQGELALGTASTLTSVAVAKGAQLTSAANVTLSEISLDVTGLQAADGLYIDLGGALTKADGADGISLNLTGVEGLANDTYTLAHWVGGTLQRSDFNLTNATPDGKVHTLTVENGSLVLTVRDLTGDLYWKGSNSTWDSTESDWVNNSDSTNMMAYVPGSTVHFEDGLSPNHNITVQGAQSTDGMVVEGGSWTFSADGDGNSLSVGKGGITINADGVTLTGNVAVDGEVKMGQNGSTLVISDGTELALNGLKLANTTVIHTGTSEDTLGIDSVNFSMSGGTLTNTTTGDVTVGLVVGDGVALVQSGDGALTLGGDHTLASLTTTSGSVALTGTTTVGNAVLSNSTVTTGGEAFSLGNGNTTVTGGTVSASDTEINAALTDVALTTTASGTTTINGTQNLTSLTNGGATTITGDVTVGSGNVQLTAGNALTVQGSLSNDNLVISGGSVITAAADKQLSLWNDGSTEGLTVAGGSITDNTTNGRGRIVNATLQGVDYTFNGNGNLTLNGTQALGTLTAKEGSSVIVSGTTTIGTIAEVGAVTVQADKSLTAAGTISGTLTNNGTVTATGGLTVGTLDNQSAIDMGGHGLTIGAVTTQGGTVNNAGTVSLADGNNAFTSIAADSVNGSGSISVAADSAIGTLNGITGVTVNGAGTTLTLTTTDNALTLSGEGKLDYQNGSLDLAGTSAIGALKAGSLSLTGTSTLDVGSLELTGGTISLSELAGMGGLLVTADTVSLGTDALKVGITVETIDDVAGLFSGSSLTLARLGGLQGVTFEDGTTTVSSDKFDREYSISVDDNGNVILTYQATGNGWVSTDGVWDGSGSDFADGDPNGEPDGEAAFLGSGSNTVAVAGDKTIKLLKVDVNAGSASDTYTFTGDSVTAQTGLVQCGTMVVENDVHFTGSLTVTETPTEGHLTIGENGTVTVDGKATGAIVNNGALSVGNGSDITLGGNGSLTVTGGNVTAGMAEDASISTLTNGGTLGFTTDATVGTLDNTGTVTFNSNATIGTLTNGNSTVTVEGNLTLNDATAQGGNVTAGSLTLADGSDNSFSKVEVSGTVTSSGTLTVGDGSNMGALSGGDLTVSGGAVSIGSATTIGTLTNSGTLTVNGDLTLNGATAQGGNVTAGSLILANGTDNTFGTVDVSGTVDNSGTLTVGDGSAIGGLSGGGALTTGGNVTVGTTGGAPTTVSTLTVADGTVTFNTDTTVNRLAGSGSLDMVAGSTLVLGGTADGCTANITAATLNLTDSTGALNLGTLSLDTIVFGSGNAGTADTALITALGITSGITLEQDTASGLLGEGNYKLLSLSGGNLDSDTIALDDATISAYQATGYAVALKVDGPTVELIVVKDDKRTWNTSGVTLEDTLGNTVQNADGTPYELVLEGADVYKSLDGVTYVHVDGNATIDLTEATPDSATDPAKGLVVRNLSGDGESTLGIVGDGNDKVTLVTDTDSAPEQAANLSLTGLEATLEGSLALGELEMTASSLDATDNLTLNVLKMTASRVDVKIDKALTVGDLSGDEASKLSGTVIVTGSNSFRGTYAGQAIVKLEGDKEQKLTLNASEGLTVTGSSGTAELIVKEESAITAIDTTGTGITLSNDGLNTLVLKSASEMEGGKLSLKVSLTKVSETLQGAYYTATTGAALELKGVEIVVTMTDTDKVSELTTSSAATDVVLFQINDQAGSKIDACTLTIHKRALLDKYFSDIRLVQGSINVVGTRRTNYYGDKFTGLSANGAVGISFAGLALSYVDPQNTDPDGDMAGVLNALDDMAPGNAAAADKLGAAFAGAGTAAMGAALAGDMDRQLRAIRNRTTTMGVSSEYVYDDMPAFNAWINAEGDYRTLDADGTMAGYKLNSWGGTVGVDADITPHFTAGLAVTAMYGDLKADSAETKAEGDLDTYYVSLFARYAAKAWVHTFVASVGMSDLTMDRTVTCGTEGGYTTSGDTSGISFGLMYEAGYVIALDEEGTACLQPVANITYKHTAVDGYNESGSDAALNVGDQTLDSVTLGLGARLQAAVGETVYNRTCLFEMRALAKVEAGDRSSSADISLPGVPGACGTVESAEADAFGIELGAGITIPVGVDAGAIFIDASAELRGSYTNVNGTFGYRINF